jgi:alpha-tubulin suppressor-like RCC1 family protein
MATTTRDSGGPPVTAHGYNRFGQCDIGSGAHIADDLAAHQVSPRSHKHDTRETQSCSAGVTSAHTACCSATATLVVKPESGSVWIAGQFLSALLESSANSESAISSAAHETDKPAKRVCTRTTPSQKASGDSSRFVVGHWRPLLPLCHFSVCSVACGAKHVVAIVRQSGRIITWVSAYICPALERPHAHTHTHTYLAKYWVHIHAL